MQIFICLNFSCVKRAIPKTTRSANLQELQQNQRDPLTILHFNAPKLGGDKYGNIKYIQIFLHSKIIACEIIQNACFAKCDRNNFCSGNQVP